MVSVSDTYFVGRLGTAPLAGLALVFPLIMLLQMTSAGAMGGGVSSAIARALGAGDQAGARRLVAHALVIAAGMGVVFTAAVLALGPPLYRLLGGEGESLRNALAYSNIIFGGAITVWVANTLSSVLRGSGNMLVPAVTLIGAASVHVPLAATLVPRIGIAGAGIAYVTTFGLAALAMALIVGRSSLRPRRGDWRLEWRLFREILRVGAISSLNALQTVVTAVIITGFVGRYGPAALAGYGVGLRLELLQIPLVFAVGQALVVLVGVNIGAGRAARAKHIAWVGAGFAAAICLVIGLTVALFPTAWVGLFSSDAAVLDSGARYLRTVAPFYALLAAGIALYFASQGAGSVLPPMLAGTVRLALVVAGGLAAVSLQGLFTIIAAAMIVYGALTIWFVAAAKWK
jgi:putative MATE family efflux protein